MYRFHQLINCGRCPVYMVPPVDGLWEVSGVQDPPVQGLWEVSGVQVPPVDGL